MNPEATSFHGDPKADFLARARASFVARHGTEPAVVAFAPGRVEILGNHTDYNGGYVMSVALSLGVTVAAGRADDDEVTLWSEALDSASCFPLPDVTSNEAPKPSGEWTDYARGVLIELARSGCRVRGARFVIVSDIPRGAGVSSSAALEVGTAEAAVALFGGRPDNAIDLAKICQRAESEFVGVPCGLLDQFSSIFGAANHLLFLDCGTLEHAAVPLADGAVRVVVADSGVQHALVDGKYASLRQSCERAAKQLDELLDEPIRQLRDVSLERFLAVKKQIDPLDRRRAEHVIRENARVLAGRDAAARGDVAHLGQLMSESHASSRDLFGNSCRELDQLVDEASELDGFLGGKLCGGGFGGSTVNLVEARHADDFAAQLIERYEAASGRRPALLESDLGAGARSFEL